MSRSLPKDLGPLVEGQVGGDDDAGAFVGPTDDLEEEFGGGLGAGDVAEFIKDEGGGVAYPQSSERLHVEGRENSMVA